MMEILFYIGEGYLLIVVFMVMMQRHLMYHPSQSFDVNPAMHHIDVITYKTADDLSLTSWYISPKNNMPVFVLFHGNAGNISNRVYKQEFFTKSGYGFLLAEYRGFGNNPGSPSEDGFYNDARAAMNWLIKTQKIDESRIIIYGESIGSGPASQMAVEYKKAKALILEAPFTSATNLASDIYPWLLAVKFLTFDKYDNIDKAAYFSMPVLIVNGDKDSVIPYVHGERLIQAVGSPIKKLVTLKGGNHTDLSDFGALGIMQNFIEGK